MNILGRDKSFYGQYKFLTSHSIFIVSSNIYRYHSCYVPRRCISFVLVYDFCTRYILYIFFFFFIIIITPSFLSREIQTCFPNAFKRVSSITSRDTRIPKRFYSKKKKKKRKRRRKGKASIHSSLLLSERERKKFRESEGKLRCFDSRVKLERR